MDQTTAPTVPLVATIKFFHSDPTLPPVRTAAQQRTLSKMAVIEQAMMVVARHRHLPPPAHVTHTAYPSKMTL